jgi:cbb3-type cytochrome oxidase subunit 3
MDTTIKINSCNTNPEQQTATPKNAATHIFDKFDYLDSKLYGRRRDALLLLGYFVILVTPQIDDYLNIGLNSICYVSTVFYFIFVSIVLCGLVGSWRDDSGNWTCKRTKSRLQAYHSICKYHLRFNKKNTILDRAYTFWRSMFFVGVLWQMLNNVCLFFRKPIEALFQEEIFWVRDFEKFTNDYAWTLIFLSIIFIAIIFKLSKRLSERINNDAFLFGGKPLSINRINKAEKNIYMPLDQIIYSRNRIQAITFNSNHNSMLVNEFLAVMVNWSVESNQDNYLNQDNLYHHLRKNMPKAKINTEFPNTKIINGNRPRIDIVINEVIYISFKNVF